MKKLLKTVLKLIVVCIIIDLFCIYFINRPIFAIKEKDNNIYRGLFYDVYNCMEYSVPQIKLKGAIFSCATQIYDDLFTVTSSGKKEISKVVVINEDNEDMYRIYYYGLTSVTLNWNGEEYDFADAIKNNITDIDSVINEIDIHKTFWDVGITTYRDGGSTKYTTNNYSILRCNTINGNYDIYIGDKDMEYEKGFCDLLDK